MFLKWTLKKNKPLIKYAFKLHQEQIILPNSYIIDLDSLLINAQKLIQLSKKNHTQLLYSINSFLQIPILSKKLEEMGYCGVINSYDDFQFYKKNNLKIANVGYFSEIPNKLIKELIESDIESISVYSIEKIRYINDIAKEKNKVVNLILKIIDPEKDIIFSYEEAGFFINELPTLIKSISRLSHIKIKGVSHTNCFIYNWEFTKELPTQNFFTLKKAQDTFKQLGFKDVELLIPYIKINEIINYFTLSDCKHPNKLIDIFNHKDIKKHPSIAYVSEISHNYKNKSYAFANNLFSTRKINMALVGDSITNYHSYKIKYVNCENNSHYLGLERPAKIGSTVIMAFPSQNFITKERVVIVEGLSNNNPKIIATYKV